MYFKNFTDFKRYTCIEFEGKRAFFQKLLKKYFVDFFGKKYFQSFVRNV